MESLTTNTTAKMVRMEVDRISNLPDNIIDQILSHLTIRDAARTSVLSTKWRYKWALLPYLVFNDSFFFHILIQCRTVFPFKLEGSMIESTIDHVLMLHFGPIYKFELSFGVDVSLAHSVLDRWILFLSRTSIKDFVLDCGTPREYRVPSSLFSCQNLTNLVLKLRLSILKPPPTFKGFRNLKSLELVYVNLAQDVFENLIASCPVLERLNVAELHGLSHLNINAPNLQVLTVAGSYQGICFENTCRLAEVTISEFYYKSSTDYHQSRASRNSSKLLDFFVQLPHIQWLAIRCDFLKYLAVGFEPCKLPKLCVDLDYLAMDIHFNKKEDWLIALCLLSSAPNLQELQISVCIDEDSATGTQTNFWEDDCWNCPFTKLRLVKLMDIGDTKPELDFVKFMLSKSPVLERMLFAHKKGLSLKDELELVKKFSRFKRASDQAEIIWLDR